MLSKVTERVEALARPVVEQADCKLWDVEYIRVGGAWYLRVYIDKDGGVNISDCEAISRALDPILDENDPIPDSYIFEVCSAGIERELKRPSDFEQFMGQDVEVRLYQPIEGKKSFVGKLIGYDNGRVSISVSGKEYNFEKAATAQVKLYASI